MHEALGYTYEDKITGFRGVCTGYVEYISGCNQLLLTPKVGDDGKMVGGSWVDEQRLVLAGNDCRVVLENDSKHLGCDMPAPVR